MRKEDKLLNLMKQAAEPVKAKPESKSNPKAKKSRKFIPRSTYKKLMKKKKKEGQSVVFNLSKIELTESMESLLNKGLNFAVMPDKLNLTDLLVNYDRFKRTMLWIEYHANGVINVDENSDDEEKPKKP